MRTFSTNISNTNPRCGHRPVNCFLYAGNSLTIRLEGPNSGRSLISSGRATLARMAALYDIAQIWRVTHRRYPLLFCQTHKIILPLILLPETNMAESGGFEPPIPFEYSRFPGVRVKPLCHLSNRSLLIARMRDGRKLKP